MNVIQQRSVEKTSRVIWGYITGDGNIWSRMASSHPNAEDVFPPEQMQQLERVAEEMRAEGVETFDQVREAVKRRFEEVEQADAEEEANSETP